MARPDIFMNLYPNPTTSFVKLDFKYDASANIQLELVDMLGRVLHSDELDVVKGQMSNYQLDLSSLSAGMYMFRLTSSGQLLNSYKFQKAGE